MEQQLVHPKVLHSKSMNRLGLIAGMFDQLEIEATIDKFLPDAGRLVSPGKIVKAMVLNGLGFVTQLI